MIHKLWKILGTILPQACDLLFRGVYHMKQFSKAPVIAGHFLTLPWDFDMDSTLLIQNDYHPQYNPNLNHFGRYSTALPKYSWR